MTVAFTEGAVSTWNGFFVESTGLLQPPRPSKGGKSNVENVVQKALISPPIFFGEDRPCGTATSQPYLEIAFGLVFDLAT